MEMTEKDQFPYIILFSSKLLFLSSGGVILLYFRVLVDFVVSLHVVINNLFLLFSYEIINRYVLLINNYLLATTHMKSES